MEPEVSSKGPAEVNYCCSFTPAATARNPNHETGSDIPLKEWVWGFFCGFLNVSPDFRSINATSSSSVRLDGGNSSAPADASTTTYDVRGGPRV